MSYELPPSLQHYRTALEGAVARELAAHPQLGSRAPLPIRGRRRTWALAGTAGSVLAGAAAAAALLLSSGAAPAYAGWSATPAAANPVAVRTALRTCGAMTFGANSHLSLAAPVLSEARGRYVAVISLHHGQATACVTDGPGEASQSGLTPVAAPGAGQVSTPVMYGSNAPGFPGAKLTELSPFQRSLLTRLYRGLGRRDLARARRRMLADSGEITVAFGRAGAGVTSVLVDFGRRATVRATVEHGWYFAWWPWRGWPLSLVVTNPSGTTTTAVQAP